MSDSQAIAQTRSRWQGGANVQRFAAQVDSASGPQRLKNAIEIDIIRRFMRGQRLLDVGIGTGRLSLPLLQHGLQLTGVDMSPEMLERCRSDPRARVARLVEGELENLPFAASSFDTVISVDTFAHFPHWRANLDELVRVTRMDGRVIVDVGSYDHVNAVARCARCASGDAQWAEKVGDGFEYTVCVSSAEVHSYAAERDISLIALIPSGAVFGSLVPNCWMSESYAFRSGGIDRLVSWTGTDPLLFAFAEFVERRILQALPPSISGRMFAVFERQPRVAPYREPLVSDIPVCDERGPAAWHAEFDLHVRHPPNLAFAVALLLAASPARISDAARAMLPEVLLRELERAERAVCIDEICADLISAWCAMANDLSFHGVDLSEALARPLQRELRDRLDAKA